MSNFLFLGTHEDTQFLPHLKSLFGSANPYIVTQPIEYLTHLEMYCQKRNVNKIISTNVHILEKLVQIESSGSQDTASLSDYAGSLFTYKGIEIVFIDPLAQLVTVKYGRFITERFISKLTKPKTWPEATEFKWTILDSDNISQIYESFSRAFAIATDIETKKEHLIIRCIGYTAIFIDEHTGAITTTSVVLPLTSVWALEWMRKFNSLKPAKIFQNGKYDISYLLRWNAAPVNYLWDTINMFHSWYAELPKDLGFLNAFFLRKVIYWKDLADSPDLKEQYRYNALDTWATANVFIQWIQSAPAWAKKNYVLEFPVVFPCILSEMTGLKRDMKRLEEARADVDEKEEEMLSSLRTMLGAPTFNPNSPVQVKDLLKLLGCGDITSTGVKEIAKAKFRHPLIARILSLISVSKDENADSIRGLRKLKSNYLRLESDAKKNGEGGAKEFNERVLYAINPHGTDTGRCASKEHHFWIGLQIQNIPAGKEVKQTISAEQGFYIAECDLEQAESRDTAHISGDTSLIAAVSGTKDFHSVNCSAFFGVPYPEIYDDESKKTRNKPLRDLAKRVNHGANYNMGPLVLVDTMGFKHIYAAKDMLKLPYSDPKKIAEYLLAQFHKVYPRISGAYYPSVVQEVGLTNRLTSRAFHHTEYNLKHFSVEDYINEGDWTRYCFGRPDKNKLDLNSYVAHCPQSLNARTLNEAYMKVFYEIALPNPKHFRLHAQIHDSILFSYTEEGLRKGLPDKVREAMEIPVTVRDVSGISRTFTVPAALKLGKTDKKTGEFVRARYWSETE